MAAQAKVASLAIFLTLYSLVSLFHTDLPLDLGAPRPPVHPVEASLLRLDDPGVLRALVGHRPREEPPPGVALAVVEPVVGLVLVRGVEDADGPLLGRGEVGDEAEVAVEGHHEVVGGGGHGDNQGQELALAVANLKGVH